MRNFALAALVALFLGLTAAPFASADENAAKAPENVTNKRCPVMGMEGYVDPKIRAEHDGQYVYFCCEGCLKMYAKDPAKYFGNLPKEDQDAIKVNDTCPVSNEKITSREIRSEVKGKLVYFCCAGCKTSFDKKAVTN
jgi:YHS domain-containing protein